MSKGVYVAEKKADVGSYMLCAICLYVQRGVLNFVYLG